MNIARTLTIFIVLAALSFVLGFFVLARLIPGGPKPVAGTPAIPPPERSHPVATAPGGPGAVGAALPPATATAGKPTASKLRSAPATAGPGPSLNPAAENAVKGPAADRDTVKVQKPETVEHIKPETPIRSQEKADSVTQEETGTRAARSETGDTPVTHVRAHRKRRHAHKVEPASEDNRDTEAPLLHKRLKARWAADRMKLTPAEKDAYAKSVVQADFEEAGDEDVIRKLIGDLTAAGVETDERQIRAMLEEKTIEAKRQLLEGQ